LPLVALATCVAWPALEPDDVPLLDALGRRGVAAVPAVWDDPAVEWSRFDAVVLRSTWDYTERREDFVAWAARVPRLFNPAPVIAWNAHKGYLHQLAAAGAPVVPTELVRAGAPLDLAALGRTRGWDEVVVKPCVSAGARNTLRLRARDGQAEVEPLRDRDLLIQPYQPEVEREGEHSLLYFGGRLSHAIRKHPALVTAPSKAPEPSIVPTPDEVAVAERVLALVPHRLLYARVDLVRGADGPQLMELEVIEPRLFFFAHPPAVERMAEAIVESIT
jgi:glutathione synthase/RimK-type ligase-like ATP-grasp enzyme